MERKFASTTPSQSVRIHQHLECIWGDQLPVTVAADLVTDIAAGHRVTEEGGVQAHTTVTAGGATDPDQDLTRRVAEITRQDHVDPTPPEDTEPLLLTVQHAYI